MEKMLTKEEFEAVKASLLDVRFPVLSHGGVTLVDVLGSDRRIVQAARCTSNLAAKTDSEDRNLIRFLMRHRHSTPVEFPQMTFLVECPMDCWRQWIRHRMASVNEFSSRYSEVPDVNDVTAPEAWRRQAVTNRQGSSGATVTEWPEGYSVVPCRGFGTAAVEMYSVDRPADASPPLGHSYDTAEEATPGRYLSDQEAMLHGIQRQVYEERLAFGVAKEQARKDLCLSTYTRAMWHMDTHNLLHFLGLRMDLHAQLEIRSYANQIGKIVQQLFPVMYQAFEDYRLNALTLTALDQYVIAKMCSSTAQGDAVPFNVEHFMFCQHPDWLGLSRCRERDESLEKLQRLGIVRKGV